MKLKNYLNEDNISFRRWGKVNEKPKKEGWYWIKNEDNNKIFIRYFDGKYIYTGIKPTDMDEYIGMSGPEGGPRRFAGPIPMPK